jgi:hypothetical protein
MAHNKTKEVIASQQLHAAKPLLVLLHGTTGFSEDWSGVAGFRSENRVLIRPEDAKSVAKMLLPDILFYDPREPVRCPHNIRTLTDDVADHFFSFYANRKVTDKIGPHEDLLPEFPYLGPPHDQRLDADFRSAQL